MKDFVFHEEALELKKLGFDEPCFGFYTYKRELRRYTNFDGELNDFQTLKNSSITMGDGWCTAPTFSQAFRWFRENGYINSIRSLSPFNHEYSIIIGVLIDDAVFSDAYYTYEEAELACLRKLIEIVKQKQ
jgi:hypothetical protein